MKVLVTGATGFIGSHLVERLVKEGYKISVLVRQREFENPPEEKKDSVKLLKKLKIDIYYGDLTNKSSLKKCVKDNEIIFHLAAIARPMAIPKELYFKVNEDGTKNLLDVCTKKKIKKIIMMSSISAVGPSRDGIAINENSECRPIDNYGFSKLAQEKMAEDYFERYKLPIVILRPPMVFGPRDFEMLRLFRIINRRFFPLKSDNECMEFLYVENLVDVCLLALKGGKLGEKYHISNEKHYSINEIVHEIASALRKKILPIKLPLIVFSFGGWIMEFIGAIFNFHPPFKHDTVKWMTERVWYSNILKAKKDLGYIPKFNLKEGVMKTVKYYQEKHLL